MSVYCILALSTSRPKCEHSSFRVLFLIGIYGIYSGHSDMTFFLDNAVVGSFERPPPGQPDQYAYNVMVFSRDSLPPGPHNLTIQNGHVDGEKSLLILDYIVYS